MNNQEKSNAVVFALFAVLTIIAVFTSGCTEEQVWTEGDKVQNDMLIKHNAVIHGLNQKDGKHQNGLIDMMWILDKRIKVLEAVDPNECPLKDNIEELNGVVDMLMEGPEVAE